MANEVALLAAEYLEAAIRAEESGLPIPTVEEVIGLRLRALAAKQARERMRLRRLLEGDDADEGARD